MSVSMIDIEQLVLPVVEEEEFVLCDLKVGGNPRRPHIQVFIDHKERFIKIEDCVKVTRSVRDLLDLTEDIPSDYTLDVSSPGIDFPMSELWQFKKNKGRLIRFTTIPDSKSEQPHPITGEMVDVTDDGWILLLTGEVMNRFRINDLKGARVVIEKPKKTKTRRKKK